MDKAEFKKVKSCRSGWRGRSDRSNGRGPSGPEQAHASEGSLSPTFIRPFEIRSIEIRPIETLPYTLFFSAIYFF